MIAKARATTLSLLQSNGGDTDALHHIDSYNCNNYSYLVDNKLHKLLQLCNYKASAVNEYGVFKDFLALQYKIF